MRILALALLAVVLGTSSGAKAGIIARDLQSPGDGLLTYDTVNQREWLDLPETTGTTLAEVLSQTGPNGRLEGFRFATLADVSGLAASAEVGWTTAWSLPFNVEPNAPEFVELLGWVIRSQGGTLPEMRVVLGLIATDNAAAPTFDDTNFYVISMPVRRLLNGPGGTTFVHEIHGGVFTSAPATWSSDFSLGRQGVGPFWLYRAVPEPSTILFLGQSLVGVVAVRRWRSRMGSPASCCSA